MQVHFLCEQLLGAYLLVLEDFSTFSLEQLGRKGSSEGLLDLFPKLSTNADLGGVCNHCRNGDSAAAPFVLVVRVLGFLVQEVCRTQREIAVERE